MTSFSKSNKCIYVQPKASFPLPSSVREGRGSMPTAAPPSRLGEVAPAARAAPPPSSVLCARWASPRGSDGVDRSRGGGSRVAGSEPWAHFRPSPTWTVRSPGTCHRPFVPMPSCAPNGDTFHVGKSTRPRLRLWGLDPGGSRDVGPLNPVLFCFVFSFFFQASHSESWVGRAVGRM